jgi:RNA polymerase sigma-70 factor (ECF subfamily)
MVQLRLGNSLAARVDASDVLQDAFAEASRKVARYIEAPRVSFFVWLRGHTQDALSKVWRHHFGTLGRSITREVALPAEDSALIAQSLMTQESPSRELMRAELLDAVKSAISEMKESDREVILMRNFKGLTNHEVAESLDIGDPTATMRHGRALIRLKALLEQRLDLSSG